MPPLHPPANGSGRARDVCQEGPVRWPSVAAAGLNAPTSSGGTPPMEAKTWTRSTRSTTTITPKAV